MACPITGAPSAGKEKNLMNSPVVYCDILRHIPEADWGEVYFQRSASQSVFYTDKKIEEVSASSSAGCSARLLKGRRTAFSVVSGVDRNAAADALEGACRIASIKTPAMPDCGFPLERPQICFPDDISFLDKTDRLLRRECPWIRQLSLSCYTNVKSAAAVCSDQAVNIENCHSSFAVEVIVERNGRVESGYSSFSKSGSSEQFFCELQPEKTARLALNEALENLRAVECPTGAMPVFLSEKAGGTIIHEACGHGMEADLVFEEQSSFAGLKGKQAAAECVTIVDDPMLPGLYGSFDQDDEGTPGRRTILVENGILKNYLTDRRTSRLFGIPLTGNGRRQSYASLPVPRMSNTYVLPGIDTSEAMIESIRHGLYVCRMGGGEVNTTTGEFVFEVTQGYLIKNGRIAAPVKGASLIGRGIEALRGIRAVGEHLCMEPGMCEKEGQSVPVTDGQPSLLIDGLVVGGTAAGR